MDKLEISLFLEKIEDIEFLSFMQGRDFEKGVYHSYDEKITNIEFSLIDLLKDLINGETRKN